MANDEPVQFRLDASLMNRSQTKVLTGQPYEFSIKTLKQHAKLQDGPQFIGKRLSSMFKENALWSISFYGGGYAGNPDTSNYTRFNIEISPDALEFLLSEAIKNSKMNKRELNKVSKILQNLRDNCVKSA